MAKLKWATFPHANKSFDYSGDKLAKAWTKLHAGDQEPFPDDERIGKLLKAHPKLGKSADAGRLAAALEDAWRAYHKGDFAQAFELGEALGPLGAAVAGKAMGIHATYLIDDDSEKSKRFEMVAALAENAIAAMPGETNAHYFRAFSLGRYGQLISIAALCQAIRM